MVFHSLEAKTAPWSSRRGMVNLFSGATLDFAAIKSMSYSPFDVCHHAYAQELNASLEASKKCKGQEGQLHKVVLGISQTLYH